MSLLFNPPNPIPTQTPVECEACGKDLTPKYESSMVAGHFKEPQSVSFFGVEIKLGTICWDCWGKGQIWAAKQAAKESHKE